jgi:hypothetical protein
VPHCPHGATLFSTVGIKDYKTTKKDGATLMTNRVKPLLLATLFSFQMPSYCSKLNRFLSKLIERNNENAEKNPNYVFIQFERKAIKTSVTYFRHFPNLNPHQCFCKISGSSQLSNTLLSYIFSGSPFRFGVPISP